MTDADIVTFAGVTFRYPQGQSIFDNLSLGLERGVFYLIRGSSGAGKSTLLRLINRLEDPLRGEIFLKGRPLSSYYPPSLRRSILYIQQTPTVIDASIKENLMLPFQFKTNRDLSRPDDDKLTKFLDDFHLNGVNLNENAQNLSVGQLQRICFIRGLLLSPEILLLDEPTSALDEKSGKVVESMAERLCKESGRTVVMVSHKGFQPEAATFVVLGLKDGGLVEI